VQEALAKEVHFLQKLKHPNLVTFYGVCLERPMVVMVGEHQVLGTVYAKPCAEMRGKQWAGASTCKLTSHVETTAWVAVDILMEQLSEACSRGGFPPLHVVVLLCLQEYYRRGSVYDILRKAEKERQGNSDPAQESTMQVMNTCNP
jgi:hypothetical protein